MNSQLICSLLLAWILVRIHLRHTWYWSLQGVKLESTPRVVEQAAARPEESNSPDLSCSLALSPSERVKEKCFPPSCAQPPIPPLFPLSTHHRAQPYNTIPLPSIYPISSSEKPHVQNQLSINIANDEFICNLLVYSSVSKQKNKRGLDFSFHVIGALPKVWNTIVSTLVIDWLIHSFIKNDKIAMNIGIYFHCKRLFNYKNLPNSGTEI